MTNGIELNASGKFLRRFRLPENAKVDEVKASMENGVLIRSVPKVEEMKPETKSIQISVKSPTTKELNEMRLRSRSSLMSCFSKVV
ncbi:hypothetical protein MKW92_027661 [Papaver armeniacum]|nr:hypothetical protein MKW92_027661 [Papaver armeniacum]